MIEWEDEAIILSTRRHGENAIILSMMTRDHGRHAGLMRGGQSRKHAGIVQPGNRVSVVWRARLEEHLGTATLEPVKGYAALLLEDAGKLLAMNAALALVEEGVPERAPHTDLFNGLDALMIALDSEQWAETYIRWEIGLLAELGFGLDLSSCAATGVTEDLVYVSPKSARAVSAEAGRPYHGKLLTLPTFLRERKAADAQDLDDGLRLSGFFLQRAIFDPLNLPLPDTRLRLARRIGAEGGSVS